jgi:small subunit ribosomal protein S1
MSEKPETPAPSPVDEPIDGATPTPESSSLLEQAMAEVPDDLDREVAQAMASLTHAQNPTSEVDITPAESIEPGTELTGMIVGVSDDEVFIEFNAKAQGVLLRSQFGKKEQLETGRRVDIVVERYDAENDILILNRKGAVQRATWMNMSAGMIVQGQVTGLIRAGLEVNLQGITAFMPASQCSLAPLKDISVLLNETIQCEVMEVDRRRKSVLVSRRKLQEKQQAEARETLLKELAPGQTRHGVVRNITDFGAFVDIGGIEGLLHISDLSWSTVEKVTDVLSTGQELDVLVLKIDKERNRISLGYKQAQPDPWSTVGEQYPEGTALKVRIMRVADFGAFAELEPGVEGLIPLSEMGWDRVGRISDRVSVGDMVDAVVIRVEAKKRRLALSMKRAQSDPWEGVVEGFTVQSLAKGRVTRLTDFGAFVEVAPGVEGLVHISELSDQRVKTCGDVLQEGQEVEARVLGVDIEKRRISLSIRQVKEAVEAQTSEISSGPPPPPKKRKKPLRGGLSSHYEW